MIQINNPEYFITVAKERSLSKAAKKLYVSNPYLSQYITKLEKSLNIKLLDRSVMPFILTDAGKLLCDHLEKVQKMEKELNSSLQALQHKESRTINIGLSSGRGSILLPNLLDDMLEEFPNVNIILHEHPSDELSGLLKDDICDFILFHRQEMDPDFIYEPLMNEKILLCAPAEHPLIKGYAGNEIEFAILKEERFVLPRPNQALTKIINNIFAQYNIKPVHTITTANSTNTLNLVAKGYGFAFLPETDILRNAQTGQIRTFNPAKQQIGFPLVVAYKRSAELFPAARKFIDLVITYYKEEAQKNNS